MIDLAKGMAAALIVMSLLLIAVEALFTAGNM